MRTDSADFTNIIPAEYRSDRVVLLVDEEPVFAIVLEVQLGVDDDKLFSWPVYATTLRARYSSSPSSLAHRRLRQYKVPRSNRPMKPTVGGVSLRHFSSPAVRGFSGGVGGGSLGLSLRLRRRETRP